MSDDAIRDLIEGVERATGPDRELDADIALTQGWQELPGDNWLGPEAQIAVPDYTSSVDAAMMLFEDSHRLVHLVEDRENGCAPVWRARLDAYDDGILGSFYGHAATPALALCCASLRAHLTKGA